MNIHSQLLLNRLTVDIDGSRMLAACEIHIAPIGCVQTRLKQFASPDDKKGRGCQKCACKITHVSKLMAGFQDAPVALMGDFNIKPGTPGIGFRV